MCGKHQDNLSLGQEELSSLFLSNVGKYISSSACVTPILRCVPVKSIHFLQPEKSLHGASLSITELLNDSGLNVLAVG